MNQQPLSITVEAGPEAVLVRVVGDITASASGELEDAISPHVQAAGPDVIVDLRATSYMSSTGLATLVQMNTRARRAGRTLRLRDPSPHLERMLTIANLRAEHTA